MDLQRKYCTIDAWLAISGMSRRTTYERLGSGDLRAVKAGSRTLIDCEAGLAWMASLPAATIRPTRRRTAAA